MNGVPVRPADSPPGAVEIEKLTVSLSGKEVLSGIDLTLHEGTFLGIVGPNGSGKTTLLRVLLGLVRPASGEVRVFGKRPEEIARTGIYGYLPQHLSVDASFPATALDVVLMGLQGRRGMFRRSSREEKKKGEEMLLTLGMAGYEGHLFGALSGGQQQRVSIARALIGDPRILILDEPSTGIDVVGQEDFYHLLKGLQKRSGLSIIMVSHDIGVITAYVDEIACLNRTLHYQGNPLGAFNEEVLKGLYGKSMGILMHDHLCDKCERLQPGER
ncbi:MAG TPA: metal ABC transporter ATP-binding protein [Thermodesulfovibrionales bacterium]|nr:metal ABC transporter ATP-binding protein [Thermodesulfovibrionales bacterium]